MIDPPRLIHLTLLSGAVFVAAVLTWLRSVAPPAGTALPADVLRYVVLVVAAVDLALFRAMRGRIERPDAGVDLTAWWRANLGAAIIVWASAEGLSLIGAVFHYLTGDLVPLAVAGVGVLLLALAQPGRLVGE
jgi:hypothetical protein